MLRLGTSCAIFSLKKSMNLAIAISFLYGLLLLIGGIYGYIKARSKPSLISGVISGLLLIFAGIIQLQNLSWGLMLAQVITIVLVIVFAIRLIKTRKFMPAGLLLVLSVASLVIMLDPLKICLSFSRQYYADSSRGKRLKFQSDLQLHRLSR